MNSSNQTSNFNGVLLHWTAFNLSGDWQKVIQNVLAPVVADGHVVVVLDTDRAVIHAGNCILDFCVRNKRARGTISKSPTAWLFALCLLSLSKSLDITVVDDNSTLLDRRYLNSKINTLGVSVTEFDDVSEKLGLIISKAFVKDNPVLSKIANFF
jgi:hypothetical protein